MVQCFNDEVLWKHKDILILCSLLDIIKMCLHACVCVQVHPQTLHSHTTDGYVNQIWSHNGLAFQWWSPVIAQKTDTKFSAGQNKDGHVCLCACVCACVSVSAHVQNLHRHVHKHAHLCFVLSYYISIPFNYLLVQIQVKQGYFFLLPQAHYKKHTKQLQQSLTEGLCRAWL